MTHEWARIFKEKYPVMSCEVPTYTDDNQLRTVYLLKCSLCIIVGRDNNGMTGGTHGHKRKRAATTRPYQQTRNDPSEFNEDLIRRHMRYSHEPDFEEYRRSSDKEWFNQDLMSRPAGNPLLYDIFYLFSRFDVLSECK